MSSWIEDGGDFSKRECTLVARKGKKKNQDTCQARKAEFRSPGGRSARPKNYGSVEGAICFIPKQNQSLVPQISAPSGRRLACVCSDLPAPVAFSAFIYKSSLPASSPFHTSKYLSRQGARLGRPRPWHGPRRGYGGARSSGRRGYGGKKDGAMTLSGGYPCRVPMPTCHVLSACRVRFDVWGM